MAKIPVLYSGVTGSRPVGSSTITAIAASIIFLSLSQLLNAVFSLKCFADPLNIEARESLE
jgi:hypothetical protein